MATPKPRVKLPKTASKNEIVTIKSLISHDMESGQRKDGSGKIIPRKIINKFTCEFNGKTVFGCGIEPAVSANPYLEFTSKVPESGTFKFTWVDDDGSVYTDEQQIKVQ